MSDVDPGAPFLAPFARSGDFAFEIRSPEQPMLTARYHRSRRESHEQVFRSPPSGPHFSDSILWKRPATTVDYDQTDCERPTNSVCRDRQFLQFTNHSNSDPGRVVRSAHGAAAPAVHADYSAFSVRMPCFGTKSDCCLCSLGSKRPNQRVVVKRKDDYRVHDNYLPVRKH